MERAPGVPQMTQQREPFFRRRRLDTLLIASVTALWVWKILEIAGREAHLLRRNLGWGYVVDLTIPVAATAGLAVFLVARWIVRRPGKGGD